MGHGTCDGGLCRCDPGFCGADCSGVLRCHVWDPVGSRWTMDGVTTVKPALGSAAFDGTTGPQSLECTADGVPGSDFAGVCVMGLLDWQQTDAKSDALSVGTGIGLTPGTIGVVMALLTITAFNVLTVRWARQSRQKALPPEERDPIWGPVIWRAAVAFVWSRWKWVNRVDELLYVVRVNLQRKLIRGLTWLAHSAADGVRLTGGFLYLGLLAPLWTARRGYHSLAFAIDGLKLRLHLRAGRKLALEPIETLGARAAKLRDRRLGTLRRVSESAKWLPEWMVGTHHVEALELLMLCQNDQGLSADQVKLASAHVWTPEVRDAVAHLAEARADLGRVLYSAQIVEEEAPEANGPIKEAIHEMQTEVELQLERSPTLAQLNVSDLVVVPKKRRARKPSDDADGTLALTPESLRLVTLVEEYSAIEQITLRLREQIRVNEVNAMPKEMEELIAKPFDPLQLDSIPIKLDYVDTLRTAELEPFIPFATDYLLARNALTLEDGSARPQMLQLKRRTVDAMMLAVAYQAAEPFAAAAAAAGSSGAEPSISELLAFRTDRLEAREALAEAYLAERNAESYLSPERVPAGAAQPEIEDLKQRIVELTLLVVDRTTALPIDDLSKDELLAHRTETLERTQEAATSYLGDRKRLDGPDGSPRPSLVALEERIVQTTLLMAWRVVAIDIAPLDIAELLALRDEEQLPMQAAAVDYLTRRGAMATKDGRPHSALTSLESRIVETTLLTVSRQLAKPIDALDIEQLRAFNHSELLPTETSVTAFLRARDALKRKGDGAPHQELLDLSDRIVECTRAMGARVLAMPFAHMNTVEELVAFRTDVVDPMLSEVTDFLASRGALVDEQGQKQPEVVALRARSIELTLAMVSLLVAKPLSQLSNEELLLLRQSELEPMEPSATGYLTFREALFVDGEPRKEMVQLEDRIVEITLTMVNQLVGKPIGKLDVDALRTFRTSELEKIQREAVEHLKSRNALRAKDGSERPELIALEDRIIECTLLMVTRVVEVPIDKLSIDEMRTHRKSKLEPMEPEAISYLQSRNALTTKDGATQREVVQLSDRIVETTLLMVSTVTDLPIDTLGVDELRALRTSKLEPMLPEASDFLRGRNALIVVGADGSSMTQPKITALSNRIIECTLLMTTRVVSIPIDDLDVPQLLALRSSPLEAIEAEVLAFLRKRNALLGPDGRTHPEVVQLADRIVEVTLLVLSRLMQKPLAPLGIEELESLRDGELQPALPAAKTYLEKRNALVDRSGTAHPQLEQMEDHIVAVTLETVERVLAIPMTDMGLGKAVGFISGYHELLAFRTDTLEVRQRKAETHLKSRNASLAKDGSPHKQMVALEAKIIDCTLYAPVPKAEQPPPPLPVISTYSPEHLPPNTLHFAPRSLVALTPRFDRPCVVPRTHCSLSPSPSPPWAIYLQADGDPRRREATRGSLHPRHPHPAQGRPRTGRASHRGVPYQAQRAARRGGQHAQGAHRARGPHHRGHPPHGEYCRADAHRQAQCG